MRLAFICSIQSIQLYNCSRYWEVQNGRTYSPLSLAGHKLSLGISSRRRIVVYMIQASSFYQTKKIFDKAIRDNKTANSLFARNHMFQTTSAQYTPFNTSLILFVLIQSHWSILGSCDKQSASVSLWPYHPESLTLLSQRVFRSEHLLLARPTIQAPRNTSRRSLCYANQSTYLERQTRRRSQATVPIPRSRGQSAGLGVRTCGLWSSSGLSTAVAGSRCSLYTNEQQTRAGHRSSLKHKLTINKISLRSLGEHTHWESILIASARLVGCQVVAT